VEIEVAARTYLEVVEPQQGRDSVIPAARPGFPILKGAEDQHLACGACKDILAWNVSAQGLRQTFLLVHRLILVCRCGAHNLVAGNSTRG
jgi:hypothetical protein